MEYYLKIPAIIIDPKCDMGNLPLTFPGLVFFLPGFLFEIAHAERESYHAFSLGR